MYNRAFCIKLFPVIVFDKRKNITVYINIQQVFRIKDVKCVK